MKTCKVLNFQEADGVLIGTSFKGYINATYSQLIAALGEPTYDEPSEDEKVQVQWVIKFDNQIFTIYDWKTYSRDYTENELEEFNIGGKTNVIDFINHVKSVK
jgi:hypothetical protein